MWVNITPTVTRGSLRSFGNNAKVMKRWVPSWVAEKEKLSVVGVHGILLRLKLSGLIKVKLKLAQLQCQPGSVFF